MTQTIEQLTARVRELEEEKRIAELIAELEHIREQKNLLWFEFSIATQQLVASQAYAEQLREALEKSRSVFHQYVRIHLDKNPPDGEKAARNAFHREICDKALATQTDTSALDAYVAKRLHDMACDKGLLRIQVEELTRQRDLAVEALQTYVDEHEECSDADDWTAMMCSVEAHYVADEALSTIKGSEAK